MNYRGWSKLVPICIQSREGQSLVIFSCLVMCFVLNLVDSKRSRTESNEVVVVALNLFLCVFDIYVW